MEGFSAAVVVISVISLSTVSFECRIDGTSSSSPYLVRIFECSNPNLDWPFTNASRCFENTTLAHGSLVSADKVLSTCTWIKLNERQELHFRIYSTKGYCTQERTNLKLIFHRNCDQSLADGKNFMVNDIALWIMNEPFDVDINALIWGGQWGGISPPDFEKMEAVVKGLNDNTQSCNSFKFSNASAVDGAVERDSEVEWVSWEDCLATLERILPIDDDPIDKPLRKVGSFTFACVRDKGISGFKFGPPQEIGYDWRSGAAVVCDADGKKVPVGMLSRIFAPAPWAKTPSFRVVMVFHSGFYEFMSDTVGTQPRPPKRPGPECKLSGENHYPYLLRIAKKDDGFEPLITVGHGALLRVNMVLSSCTSYRKLPEDLSKDKNWMFIGYNPKASCTQRRRPLKLYMHPDCLKYGPDQILANDFAIWIPDRDFAVDARIHDPNLWQGPNEPPMKEVVRSIWELSDDTYIGVISRRLPTGVFLEPKLATAERQINAEVQFVPWGECQSQLHKFVQNTDDVKMESVADKNVYPVFCGIENFRSAGPKTNKSIADWYAGAMVMYSFLYVWDWGDEPTTITYPIGVFSRVVVGQSKPHAQNIRVIAGFSQSFYDFLESAEVSIQKYYISTKSCQPSCKATVLVVLVFSILFAAWDSQ